MDGAELSGDNDQKRGDWPGDVSKLSDHLVRTASVIEETGKIPPDLLRHLHELGVFRLLIPKSLKGFELRLIQYMETIEQIAQIDASVAWCVGQASGCSFSAAYVDKAVASDVFGPSNAIVAWGPATQGSRAVIVDGGYELTGSWMYASGSRQATWLGAHAKIVDSAGSPLLSSTGAHIERTFLVPRNAARITDVWQVMGLRGTGSDNYAFDCQFVPDAYSYSRDSANDRRESGYLYRLPILGTFAIAFASVALGIARSTLDSFVELASVKVPKARTSVLRDSGVVQLHVGGSEARLRAARCYLVRTIEELTESLSLGSGASPADLLNLRMAVTHAIQECRDIVEKTYLAAGAAAIFNKNSFEKRFRDMHAVSQQIQGHIVNLETAGKVILGVPGAAPRI